MKPLYFGILAGGSGERLWPLSRRDHPKQLIPFLDKKSLLEQAIDRVKTIAPSKENIFVITNQHQESHVQAVVGDQIGFLVSEPAGRNTGPAILLGCKEVYARDPEAIVIFLPADHFIPEIQPYSDVVERVVAYLQNEEKLVTIGLRPTFPATGYGYIQADFEREQQSGAYAVNKFHEKPEKPLAESYFTRPDMLWNIGLFGGQVTSFLREFASCAPELVEQMERYVNHEIAYQELTNISIDYAVMEKSENLVVFPASFEWFDVGNLPMFLSLQSIYSHQHPSVINVESHRNLVSSNKKVVAFVGVSDLCIVETDDVLLVVQQDKAELVKALVSRVAEANR